MAKGTSRKPKPTAPVEERVQGTPKFRIGQTVYRIKYGKVVTETITGILLYHGEFFYTSSMVRLKRELDIYDFDPESAFFATKEELLASL